MLKKVIIIVCLLATLLTTGCTTKLMDFTIFSTQNAEISRIDLKKMQQTRAYASDGRFWFLFFPFGSPDLHAAARKALERSGGDVLMDGTATSFFWTLLIFSYDSYYIEGNAINTKEKGARNVVDP